MAPRNRINMCILMNVILPKLEFAGEVWEGNAKFVKQLERVQMAAAKKKVQGINKMLKHDGYCSVNSKTGDAPTRDK